MTEDLNTNYPFTVPFLTAVREYCGIVEQTAWNSADLFIKSVHKNLIVLYQLGCELPLVELTKWYADTLELETNTIAKALDNIKANVPFQYYWTVLNPIENAEPANGTGDLIDDLLDIYKELKLALTYFDEIEGYQEHALWTFKTTFSIHWADHCMSALYAIHNYLNTKV